MRKIVIDGEIWKYRIGRSYVIAEYDSRKLVAHQSAITGQDPYWWERDKRKRNLHITPADIERWLRRERVHA